MKIKLLILMSSFLFLAQQGWTQEITMKGLFYKRYYEDGVKLSKAELKSLLQQDDEAYKLWEKARTQRVVGIAITGFGASANRNRKKAILRYNENAGIISSPTESKKWWQKL